MGAARTTRRGARPPETSATQRELRAAKATLRPSGESAGRCSPRTGRTSPLSKSYRFTRYRGRFTGRVAEKGISSYATPLRSDSSPAPAAPDRTAGDTRNTRNRPSTVSSNSSRDTQRGGTGCTSPVIATGSPATTSVQEAAGAAVVRR
ncbi:hypothetical protein SANTM175S_08233 [Streptomyces antimycoticus]